MLLDMPNCRSRRRTRWLTTSSPTPRTSSCRFGRGVEVERLEKADGRFVVSAGDELSRPRTWSWPPALTTFRRLPPSPPSSIRGSCSSIRRLPQSVAAPGGRRPPRRSRQLRRGARGRAEPLAPRPARRSEARRDPGQARHASRPARLPRLPVPGPPRADARHPDRPQARPEADRRGRPADPDAVEGARRRRRRARAARDAGRERTAGPGGRTGARRRERRLVHRLPHGLRLDRPAGLRRGRRAKARAGRRRVRAGPVLPRAWSSSTRSPPTFYRAVAGTPIMSPSTSQTSAGGLRRRRAEPSRRPRRR